MTTQAAAPRTSIAICVFAVRRATGREPALPPVTGHAGGGPVRTVTVGTLAAVIQDVPADEFSEAALRERFSDRDALERCARAHHEVVAAAAATGPAVPLPLATLYLDEDRARAALVRDEPRLRAVLDRIEGRAEWGVKVSVAAAPDEPPAAPAPAPAPATATATATAKAAPPDTAVTGRAYLDRLRTRRQAGEERREAALRAAEWVHTTLSGLSAAARRLRAHGPGVTGERHRQVLNAAYLVDASRAAELAAAVETLRRDPDIGDRLTIELTGPWAPYSFTGGAETEAGDDGDR
ncbi:GvpL/GvpF family gas vesicle protein [Streptomyces sp. NBC_01803]|uniref:GvpL/GvpF family gas vesicle protein n=1 Tax=Streptomyces sp. NBC_01803 TaxID=2975946 RepID=UPI002DD7D2E0|nr:GvpL/GvpF family gas vesicle protein [Streptomyces sp. NBC_01803]WSA44170.1 GvpL/GvpF family gas vesicle protein [Streptomyces sp. NBC_01803]